MNTAANAGRENRGTANPTLSRAGSSARRKRPCVSNRESLLLLFSPRAILVQKERGPQASTYLGIVLTDGLKRQRDPPPPYHPRQ
jgi:hypothetical protein